MREAYPVRVAGDLLFLEVQTSRIATAA